MILFHSKFEKFWKFELDELVHRNPVLLHVMTARTLTKPDRVAKWFKKIQCTKYTLLFWERILSIQSVFFIPLHTLHNRNFFLLKSLNFSRQIGNSASLFNYSLSVGPIRRYTGRYPRHLSTFTRAAAAESLPAFAAAAVAPFPFVCLSVRPLQVHNATLECPERADEIDANRRRAHIDILAAHFEFPANFVRMLQRSRRKRLCYILKIISYILRDGAFISNSGVFNKIILKSTNSYSYRT